MTKILIFYSLFAVFISCAQAPNASYGFISPLTQQSIITENYQGEIPCADCPGIVYKVSISHPLHSADGTFAISMTYLEAENGKDITVESSGKYYTLRGNSQDPNATIYELIDSKNKSKTYFLKGKNEITMLDLSQNEIKTSLNYTLTLQQ